MEELIRLSQLEILQQTDYLKAEIDALRPLSKEQEGRIMQKFRLDWNYHSNAIEGNSLDYGETVAFLMHGITAKGKPFKDYLDIKGHNEAIDFLLELIRTNDELTEKDIRSLHQLLLVEPYEVKAETPDGYPTTKRIVPGRYKTSPNHVRTATGAVHYYASPEETPIKMQELMDWYREAKANSAIHPVVLAAVFHHRFVSVHPFDDGNGRMTRLLMNLMLMQAHYPPVVINQQERGTYYLTLSQADTGEDEPFVEFIGENVSRALELYLRGARGENLDEPSDLDKELVLFKKEVEGQRNNIKVVRSLSTQANIYDKSIKPFIDQVRSNITKFKDLFISYEEDQIIYSVSQGILNKTRSPLISFLNYDNSLDYLLHTDTSFQVYQIAIALYSFRQLKNTFDINVLIEFKFNTYEYSIAYGIEEQPRRFLKKLYDQHLSETEKEELINAVGREVLGKIKSQYHEGTPFVD